MVDRHVRRSGDDYIDPYVMLLPKGDAWPSWDKNNAFMSWVAGACQIWGDIDGRADDLLVRESDPRSTIELLPDWERAFGLPDDCLAEPVSIDNRQKALVNRITLLGAQSRKFFSDLAASIGYDILIIEHSPFMAGISQCGDTRNWNNEGSPWYRWEISGQLGEKIRFYWTIDIMHSRLTWFRACAGQAGVDPHLRIALATDLECLFYRYKPAHTDLAFDYSGLNPYDKLAGTP